MKCHHCGHELTPHEIGVLSGNLGGFATTLKRARMSSANSRAAGVLLQKDVDYIRKSNKPIKKLAEKYNVSYLTVWRVKKNKTRISNTNCPHCGHELTPHDIGLLFGMLGGAATSVIKAKSSSANGRTVAKLTQKDADNIRKSSISTKKLAEKYKVSYHTIWRIRRKEIWKETT